MKRMFWLIGGGLGLMAILFILFFTSSAGPGTGSVGIMSAGESYPWFQYLQGEGCTPDEQQKYESVQDNQRALDGMISDFTNIEKHYPQSYAELMNSVHASIRPADMLNPYTGQPIQQVSQPSAGDISWQTTPTTLTVTFYYLCNGEILSFSPIGFDEEFLNEAVASTMFIPEHLTQQNDRYTFMVCEFMDSWFLFFHANEGRMPNSFDELANLFPFLRKVRNEFTGGYAQNVPSESRSPGNFTYQLFYDSQGNYDSYGLWCYGSNNETL